MPPKMLEGLVTFWNQRPSGKDFQNRKATNGEAICFCGYMAAIALYTGEKVEDSMWRDLPLPGDILPPLPWFAWHVQKQIQVAPHSH
eukprot:4364530-Pleurochrysis_carterae.AAC.1